MINLFKRLNDIINANVNDLLDQVEDPERMIKQVIREMEIHIQQCQEEVLSAITSEKHLQQQLKTHRNHSEYWLKKAQIALEEGREDLARSALARKQEVDVIVNSLKTSWETAKNNSEHLKDQLHKLKTQLEAAKIKRNTLITRQRAVQAHYHIHKTVDKLHTDFDLKLRFNRMEDKVLEMEARTEALIELEQDQLPLEKAISQLETDKEIETELSTLKLKIKHSS